MGDYVNINKNNNINKKKILLNFILFNLLNNNYFKKYQLFIKYLIIFIKFKEYLKKEYKRLKKNIKL